MGGKFLDPLELEWIDGRTWRLTAGFRYHLGTPDGDEAVVIPAGFVTDFASIPRALWPLLPPTGAYGKAAVVHDWLYERRVVVRVATPSFPVVLRLVDRGEADGVLSEAMAVIGVGRLTRWTIHAGVRAGGWVPWRAYRRRESQ